MKFTLNRKLISMIVVLWIGLLLIGALGAWRTRATMVADREEQLRSLVQQADSIAAHYYRLAQQGTLGEADARKQALAALADLRYGKDGYIAVINSHLVIVMNPFLPQMNGKDASGMMDGEGKPLFPKLVAAGNEPGGGFAEYVGRKPGSGVQAHKVNYVMRFAPWDWYLATGMYMDDVEAAFTHDLLWWLLTTTMLAGVCTILDEISHASQEQSAGIEQVNCAVGEMDQVTQQNAALVEEAAAAAHSLRDQVGGLRDAIARFTLPGREPGRGTGSRLSVL